MEQYDFPSTPAKSIRMQLPLSYQAAISFAFLCVIASFVRAESPQELSDADIAFFETRVRPLLISHCLECHGDDEDEIAGGLDLRSRQVIAIGGDSGSAIDIDSPQESLLLKAIRYEELEMPPDGKLESDKIEVLHEWVTRGLPDPRSPSEMIKKRSINIEEGRKFWAFTKPEKASSARITDSGWSRNYIDELVESRHRSEGVSTVGDADRQTLVRRIYIDLVGLPPTPKQLDAFISDDRSDDETIASLVDRLLAIYQFGERWGRHWLDVARFAESSGGGRSLMFKNAWRYRDYVVDSFNSDKPYDQFVVEQIAGDLLDSPDRNTRADQIVATGFLALGPTNYEQQDKALLRMEVIDEQIDTVGRAFLGMSLGCARCHDHKFDPIPTTDYYALAGIFGSTKTLTPGNVSGYVETPLPLTAAEQTSLESHKAKLESLTAKRNSIRDRLMKEGFGDLLSSKGKNDTKPLWPQGLQGIVVDSIDPSVEIQGNWTHSTSVSRYVGDDYIHDAGDAKGKKSVAYSVHFNEAGRFEVRLSYSAGANRATNVPVTVTDTTGEHRTTVNQREKPPIRGALISLGTYQFDMGTTTVVKIETMDTDGVVIADAIQIVPVKDMKLAKSDTPGSAKEQLNELTRIEAELTKLEKIQVNERRVAMSVEDSKTPGDGHVHIRGEVRNLGPIVPRGFLTVASSSENQSGKIGDGESGRLQLARWIASSENPLTARVYVNRIWQHLFGRGLVGTPDNHGTTGEPPSHAQLLDQLAIDFVENGWSTKATIRRIMLSRTYRQASTNSPTSASIDPDNRLLWRANRRRNDAEVIRDSILLASGSLDHQAEGLTITKFSQYDWGYDFGDFRRRSVYVPLLRNTLLEILEVFDLANPNLVTGARSVSTLPTQALYLMNSPFVIEQSKLAASLVLSQNSGKFNQSLNDLFRRVYGRDPTYAERASSIDYIRNFKGEDPALDDDLEAMASLCQMLFASVDFRYVQ